MARHNRSWQRFQTGTIDMYAFSLKRKNGDWEFAPKFYDGNLPEAGDLMRVTIGGEEIIARIGIVGTTSRRCKSY
jgi:hypothetical protein